MSKNLVLAIAAAVSGCAAPYTHPLQPSLPNGTWAGTMSTVVVRADDSKKTEQSRMLLATCDGAMQVWSLSEEGKIQSYRAELTRSSKEDSHLLYFVEAALKQPDWVEIQTYSLVLISADKALLLWTRTVSNRDVSDSDSERFFYGHGTAQLKRIDQECHKELVHVAPAKLARPVTAP
jgi:hypothetical protein